MSNNVHKEGLLSAPTSTGAAQTISMWISILLNAMQMTAGRSQLVRLTSRWLWWICCRFQRNKKLYIGEISANSRWSTTGWASPSVMSDFSSQLLITYLTVFQMLRNSEHVHIFTALGQFRRLFFSEPADVDQRHWLTDWQKAKSAHSDLRREEILSSVTWTKRVLG